MNTMTLEEDRSPFSSLFPIEELQKEEEQKRQQRELGQSRIMKTNAVGDALRLLFDSIGGSMGATITPKGVNPGIVRASDKMQVIQRDSDNAMDRLRLTDLGNKQLDVKTKLGLEAEKRAAEQRAGEIEGARKWEGDKLAEARTYDSQKTQEAYGQQEKMQGLQTKGQIQVDNARTANDIALQKAREGYGTDANNPYQVAYRKTYGTKAPYFEVVDKESGHTIPLSETKAYEILGMLRNDPALDILTRNKVTIEDLKSNPVIKQYVVDNWERYKPIVQKMALGQPIAKEEINTVYSRGKIVKRQNDYNRELTVINDSDKSAKKRAKEITKLNEDYSDLFVSAPTEPQVIPATPEGVTDVSSIFLK